VAGVYLSGQRELGLVDVRVLRLRDVEHDTVVVGERPRADRDVAAVVAEERWADDHAFPDVAEQLS